MPQPHDLGHGLLIAISSPSGGGKTTIIHEVQKRRPEIGYSVSCTTRKPRTGEINGKDYIFLSEREFKQHIEHDEFLEWESVHGYLYGTLIETVSRAKHAGQHLLFDIDVYGAQSLKRAFPDSLLIFLNPPDLDTLMLRLKSRAKDSQEEIDNRLKRVEIEMEIGQQFDIVIVNDKLDDTVNQVIKAIDQRLANNVKNQSDT